MTGYKHIKNLAVISLANPDEAQNYFDLIKRNFVNSSINFAFTSDDNIFEEHINNIMKSDQVILMGQIGYTDRKSFNQLKDVCKELKKDIINNFLIV